MNRYSRLALGVIVVIGVTVPRPTAAAARNWSIAVCGPASDPQRLAVTEAVEFWNGELRALNTKLSLGPIAECDRVIPDDLLKKISDGVLSVGRGRRLPREFEQSGAEVVIALSGADLISVGMPPASGRPGLVILRRGDIEPLSLPNVARNVVAHELGHVLGLPHNSNPTLLMCGRPSPCRPALFRSQTKSFFPLTEAERNNVAKRFR